MYLNKVFIIGNLARDPELRALPSGMNVANFSIATNRVWKDRDGKKQENVDFHNVVIFGRQADNVAAYLRKGSMAYIEGRLTTRSWDGQDGKKQYRTEVVAETIQFGPKNSGGGSSSYNQDEAPARSNSRSDEHSSVPQDSVDIPQYPEEEINPEDIPF